MKSILTSVINPVWSDENHTMIDCKITTSQFGDEVLPFTASQNDVEEHGRIVFDDIVKGVYGEIGAYVPPPEPVKVTATSSSGEIPQSVL